VRLWQTFNEGTPIINVRALLFTIARNRIIDWYRKKKNLSLEAVTELSQGEFFEIGDYWVEGAVEMSADASLVLSAINKLSPQYKEAVYLRFVEDLLPQDIAQILHATPNAVSVRINRGLQELRTLLGIKIE
jgi:RNA polymerase sigma-70 factor (ECF subfamily)